MNTAILGVLLTVGVTILIYFANKANKQRDEAQRKRQERLIGRRASLMHAAEWVGPIELAVSDIHTRDGRSGRAWARLLSDLAELDKDHGKNILLPEGMHRTPGLILNKLEEIQNLSDYLEGRDDRLPKLEEELISRILEVGEMAAEFRKRIDTEIRATYK